MKSVIAAVLLLLPLMVQAQERSYEPGNFWQISGVKTMPAKFDAYIDDISGLWRSQMEKMKDDGKIVSYHIMANVHPRESEPDLWLMVQWASAADMLDTPWDYWDELTDDIVGSAAKSRELAIDRGELRIIMGDTLAREITFK